MAATVQIRRLTGANSSITSTDVTSGSVHAGTQDANTSPCKIPVPTSGCNYSFWVNTQLNCTVAPDNSLTNIFWYTDGASSFGTGVNAIVIPASGYASAIGTAGSSGQLLTPSNHGAAACTATSPLFLYTSSCKLTVTGSTTTTGSFGNRVVIQLNVETTAGAGNTGAETITWTYDEA
jgi:hypothetical protein